MRRFITCSFLLALLLCCSGISRGFQGEDPNKNPPSNGPKPPKQPRPIGDPPHRGTPNRGTPKPQIADLTITAAPGVTVFVDNQQRGATDASGKLMLKGLKAGQHRVVVKKQNYLDAERTVLLFAGDNRTENFGLVPAPGVLSVSTTVPGTLIIIAGVGGYTDRVDNLSLPPADYQISASKPGYRSLTRTVTLAPGQSLALPLTLEKMSVDELISGGRESLSRHNYPDAVALLRLALSSQPNNSTAALLLGQSYYEGGSYAESVEPFEKALSLGEKVAFPVRHRHSIREMCSGTITLSKGSFAFASRNILDESYEVPFANFREISVVKEFISEPHYLHTKIRDLRRTSGKKEGEKDLNFYTPETDGRLTSTECPDCKPRMEVIEQLMLWLRGQGSGGQ